MSKPAITAFQTTYVLSSGKIEEIAVDRDDGKYALRVGNHYGALKWGRDIFRDRADAVNDANQRRTKKVLSLSKQIVRLKELDLT